MERWLGPVVMAAGILLLIVGILIAVFLPLEGRAVGAAAAQLDKVVMTAESAPLMAAFSAVMKLVLGKIGAYFMIVGIFVGILLSIIGAGLVLIGYIVHGLIKMALGALQALAGGGAY